MRPKELKPEVGESSSAESTLPELLNSIYREYHHPSYISPDPLEFLYLYSEPGDREIVGLIASSLAIGRVNAILSFVTSILEKLPSPREDLLRLNRGDLDRLFSGYKYRFYDDRALTDFLYGIGRAVGRYGSLNSCFLAGFTPGDAQFGLETGLEAFVRELGRENRTGRSVLPHPGKGSACKRLHLFLRWMVRSDCIDPGGWTGISPSELIIPLDTHIFQIGRRLGFTRRSAPDKKAALEITEALRKIDSEDPVRFDFSLSRLGIHPLLDYSRLEPAEPVEPENIKQDKNARQTYSHQGDSKIPGQRSD